MIDFNKLEEKVINSFYDGNGDFFVKMFVDDKNKIMKGCLKEGASIGLHTHETSSEIIFIISGTGKQIIDGQEEILKAGDCHYCKKGQSHTFINIGNEDLVFYAVVPQQ
ncbi:MAG: cupin domain-containing protein [Clostridia bacterium]|nr:cupin domain-containing protein [Clostridia bacterium]